MPRFVHDAATRALPHVRAARARLIRLCEVFRMRLPEGMRRHASILLGGAFLAVLALIVITLPVVIGSPAKPKVRAHAPSGAYVLIELRAAKTCEAKAALLSRARDHGDARALAELRALTKKTGCGRRGAHDCWPCLRDDGALEAAIRQIARRTRADGAADAIDRFE